jgi:hypothetical protein
MAIAVLWAGSMGVCVGGALLASHRHLSGPELLKALLKLPAHAA